MKSDTERPLVQSTTGVGVIDTTSLWAASALLGKPSDRFGTRPRSEFFIPETRSLYTTKHQYFLSVIHNLMLYEELRTDTEILEAAPHTSRDTLPSTWPVEASSPVTQLLTRLSSAVKISSIPSTITSYDLARSILPAFMEKMRHDLQKPVLTSSSNQIAQAASAYASAAKSSIVESMYGFYFDELAALARSDLGPNFQGLSEFETLAALSRNLSTLARTILYASHSQFIHNHEKRPSAL
jgi:hypothetical protein